MTFEETVILTTVISAAQNIPFTDESKIKVWHLLLEDLDSSTAHLAVKTLLRTQVYTLTPAHIREAYNDIINPKPDALEAWSLITDMLSIGRYQHSEAMAYVKERDPIVYEIVKNIGFVNICNSNEQFFRTEFEKIYKSCVSAMVKSEMLPDAIKKQISQVQGALCEQHLKSLAVSEDGYYGM